MCGYKDFLSSGIYFFIAEGSNTPIFFYRNEYSVTDIDYAIWSVTEVIKIIFHGRGHVFDTRVGTSSKIICHF